MKGLRVFGFGLMLLVASLAFAPHLALAQDEAPYPAIIATEDGVTVPEQIPAGIVTLSFQNETEAPFGSAIMRLNEGKTMDDFAAAMQSNVATVLETVTLYSTPKVDPASSITVTYELPEGHYLLLVMNEGSAPTVLEFTAAGEGEAAEAPTPDVEFSFADTGFTVPESVSAGEQVWQISHAGEQLPLWFVIYPAGDAATAEDAYAAIQSALGAAIGDPSLERPAPLLYLSPMSPGTSAWVTLDLEPGSYLLLLQDIDLFSEPIPGMIGLLTVGE